MVQQHTEQPVDEPAQRITHRQAATLLGCHVSNIAKLVKKGHLTSTGMRGPGVGTLDLDEVLQLREQRARDLVARRAARQAAAASRPQGPPDDDHDWIDTSEAALRLGVTDTAVQSRARRGTIPHVRCGKRIWVRADQLEVWKNARAVKTPDDLDPG